ncbi:S1 family peptidase [Kribbella sandramycini]|uniref:S1 family peptidase n=1 Tax=Kribbella sandramycini TaxID=60450 RepID=A0A7Y4P010_9ACTN|nr:S1 family peptidase [Kribbella sandramycini]MBB6564951.1 streptogrisin C [Kribbella sandramycini]NOL42647.1 S1 family peptidase [Kribbella sandramycini]
MSGRYRAGAALAGAALLTAAGLAAASWATADDRGPAAKPRVEPTKLIGKSPLAAADAVEAQVGERAVGAYYDSTGELVVAVSDAATAELVRAAGAVPKLVRHTAAELGAVQAELNKLADRQTAGKVRSWYVDPISGTVVVSVPKGARDVFTERFLRRAKEYGDQVTVKTAYGKVVPTADDFSLRGGFQVDKNTGYVCSLGFNARNSKGTRIFLTAGHCTSGKPSFSRNGYILGNTLTSSFPGNDYGSVDVIEGWDQQGYIEGWGRANIAVHGYTNATVGAEVCKSGKSTGWSCGRIVARNVTVNYGNNKVVRGLFQHTACVRSGDSGGATMTGNWAQGITSGAALIDGKCLDQYDRANESYAQPIGEALQATQSELVLGN